MSKFSLVIILLFLFVTTTTFQHVTPVDTAKIPLKSKVSQTTVCPALDSAEANLQLLIKQQDSVSNKVDILKTLLTKDKELTYEQRQQIARILKND